MNIEGNFENPFEITRTEHFNTNYSLFADYFEEPPFYEDLIGRLFFIIVGTRGTGKSMILKSLYLPVFIERLKKKGIDPLKFKWKFIGVYIPCDNLDLQKYFNDEYYKYFGSTDFNKGEILWRRYLCNYLALYIVEEVLRTLVDYGGNIGLKFVEGNFLEKILEFFDPQRIVKEDWPKNFGGLPAFFAREKRLFLDFVMEKVLNPSEEFTRPFVRLSFMKDVCNTLISESKKLKECRFYILLDDFFSPFITFKQQAVLLDLMRERRGPLSFKVTTVPEGITYTTDSKCEMHPTLDYGQKFLECTDVGRDSEYWNLITKITKRRVEKYGIDYSQIFEEPYVQFEISLKFKKCLIEKKISKELSDCFNKKGCFLSNKAKIKQMEDNIWKVVDKKPEEKTLFTVIPKERITYTIVKKKDKFIVSTLQTINDFLIRLRGEVSQGHDVPIYAGFDMLVEMSSGVVNTYLELAREIVNLMLRSRKKKGFSVKGLPISDRIQDKVVRKRSNLIVGTILSLPNGQSIYKLATIMARYSRKRFLKNREAKEYIQYKIKNYENLKKDAHNILMAAFSNNVFHSPDCHPTDREKNIILRTLILNRLLTPALKIPYRDRWGVEIDAGEIEKILLSHPDEPLQITEKPPISATPQPMQMPLQLEKRETSPIIKDSSCRIFPRSYCTKISELLEREPGAFLALPFREDWHKNTEKLLKNKIDNIVTSLDESPHGDFTCKICELIHKKDFGIYEISILNDNVIFEMGLSVGLGKHTFAIWNEEKWTKTWDEKKSPIAFLINGFEGFPYSVTEKKIAKMANKMQKSVEKISWNKDEIVKTKEEGNIFLAMPVRSDYYKEKLKGDALKALKDIGTNEGKIVKLPEDFREGLTLMNTFRWILKSNLCIVDSTRLPKYEEYPELLADYIWRMFALGVAVGLRKPLLHCFNTAYTREVASDIRGKCNFTYNDTEIYDKLLRALKEVYNHEKIR